DSFGQCLAWGGVNQPAVATRTLGREVDDAGHLRGDVRVRNPQLLARGHEVRVPVGVPTPGVRVTQQPHQLGRHHRPPVGVRVSEGHDLVGLVQLERLRRDRAWNLAAGLHHQRVVPQLRGTDTPDAVESGGAVVVVVGAADDTDVDVTHGLGAVVPERVNETELGQEEHAHPSGAGHAADVVDEL